MFDQPKLEKAPPPPSTPIMADPSVGRAGERERKRTLINRASAIEATAPLTSTAKTGKRSLLGGS